jgi:hypothetical protein
VELLGEKWPVNLATLLLEFFYMPQIYDMGQYGFYFPSEEGVLRIFSP